jgi:hypothetical protein
VDVSRSFRVFKLISQPLKNRRIQRVVKFSHPSFLPLVEMVVLALNAFSGRSFHVPVNNTDSATHHILYGVPQGAILSSSLINNFFTVDSSQSNESDESPAEIPGWFAIYYNDTLILFPRNAAKTQATYFTRCWSPR